MPWPVFNTARLVTLIAVVVGLDLFVAPAAVAQPVPGDGLVPAWSSHRAQAETMSDLTVAAAVVADTWDTFHAPDRSRALTQQLIREGAIFAISTIAKRAVGRRRPDGSDRRSFFSEHTAFAASAFGGPRVAVVLPLTIGTGYLRIAADKHYLTDALAGAAVGSLIGHYTR